MHLAFKNTCSNIHFGGVALGFHPSAAAGGIDTYDIFVKLMGKGEAASRRAWMEEKGNLVEADV